MKISIDWLRDYVKIDLPAEELAVRLTQAGLESEGIEIHGDDPVIELEVVDFRVPMRSMMMPPISTKISTGTPTPATR